MAKGSAKGIYTSKVGFYNIYKTLPNPKGGSVDFVIYHSKKMVAKGLKKKEEAVEKCLELLGTKYKSVYGL
jgi:hypothetical protein